MVWRGEERCGEEKKKKVRSGRVRTRACSAGPHEKRLLHALLDNYNSLERPVVNESDPLQLSFGLTLMQIIDVAL
ncbi:hypothetical protein ACLKA7_011932 [Drosophila subpalustris]